MFPDIGNFIHRIDISGSFCRTGLACHFNIQPAEHACQGTVCDYPLHAFDDLADVILVNGDGIRIVLLGLSFTLYPLYYADLVPYSVVAQSGPLLGHLQRRIGVVSLTDGNVELISHGPLGLVEI